MESSYHLVDALRVLIRWRTRILIFVVVVTLGSVVVSLLMPDEFQSKVVFYPMNPAATDRATLFNEKGGDVNMDYFGSKSDVNRMLTIAYSSSVMDFLINHFKLYEHYGYDTLSSPYWRFKTKKKLEKKFQVMKTEQGALELSVMDVDPARAATMANLAVEMIEKVNKQMIIGNKSKILDVFRQKLIEKKAEVESLGDTLSALKGIYNIQVLDVSKDGNPILTGSSPMAVENYRILYRIQENALKDYTQLASIYDQFEATAREDISTIYIVEEAFPAIRKTQPVRSLIVVGSFLAALFLAISGALMAERIDFIRKQL